MPLLLTLTRESCAQHMAANATARIVKLTALLMAKPLLTGQHFLARLGTCNQNAVRGKESDCRNLSLKGGGAGTTVGILTCQLFPESHTRCRTCKGCTKTVEFAGVEQSPGRSARGDRNAISLVCETFRISRLPMPVAFTGNADLARFVPLYLRLGTD